MESGQCVGLCAEEPVVCQVGVIGGEGVEQSMEGEEWEEAEMASSGGVREWEKAERAWSNPWERGRE